MGANHSATAVTNELINDHVSDLQCNYGRQAYQFTQAAGEDGITIKARGDCKVNIGNSVSLKSGCDMSAIRKVLTSQEAKEKLEQTAAAGLSFNTKSTKLKNVTRNVESILMECKNEDKARQEVVNKGKKFIDCDDNFDYNFGNTGILEAECLLSKMSELEARQSLTAISKQLIKGLLDFLNGPFGTVLLLILIAAAAFWIYEKTRRGRESILHLPEREPLLAPSKS